MPFDIATLDTRTRSEAGVPMQILHPSTKRPIYNDANQPVTVTLLGRNSDAYRAAQRESQSRRAAFEARGVMMTEDDYEQERQTLLCAVTVGWNFDTMDGSVFPFTPENCRRLWADRRWTWLASDAFNFVHQDGNFLAA
jgi:hypothetical protein